MSYRQEAAPTPGDPEWFRRCKGPLITETRPGSTNVWKTCMVCDFSGGYDPEQVARIKTCPVLKGPYYRLRAQLFLPKILN